MIISQYTIELQIYHNEIVGRLKFESQSGEIEESGIYSLPEIQNIIALWKIGGLQGSFAMGTQLSEKAVGIMTQK